MARRTLAVLLGAALAPSHSALAHGGAPPGAPPPPREVARALPMSAVVLTPGSRWHTARARNAAFLLGMNVTDVLCEWTSAANLTGSFSAPTCRFLDSRGHMSFAGHFLSATAMLCNATGDAAACDAGSRAVARLADAQAAWSAVDPALDGYLFPYAPVAFVQLFSPPYTNCDPVCVPWNIVHKVLAGLLDQAELAGSARALAVALGVAAWTDRAVAGVLARGGQALWQAVLTVEWGGMNDALFRLHGITGDPRWLAAGALFEEFIWTAPLASGADALPGQHANTRIAQVLGDARGWALTGNATQRAIVATFSAALATGHAFATGGSNDHEHWGAARALGDQMNADTEESCTTYNAVKLARAEFALNATAAVFDVFERALVNGLLGNQATTGAYAATPGFIYMLPLGGVVTKAWGAADAGPPGAGGLVCCWGTLSETFSKLSDGVAWESADGGTLYINMFVGATISWRGATVVQETGYPYAARATTRLVVTATTAAVNWTLALRVPAWARRSNTILVNGAPLGAPVTPGTYARIARVWAAGDVVDALFEPTLRWEPLNDARSAWRDVGALVWGGVVLAAVNVSTDALPLNTSDPGASVTRSSPPAGGGDYTDLTFTAIGASVTLIPLMDVAFERYAVYLHAAPTARVDGGAASARAAVDVANDGAARAAAAATVSPPAFAPTIRTDVFLRGEGGYYCVKIPVLLPLASGALLAFGEGRRDGCSDWAPTDLVYKRSLDGGATWSSLAVLYSNSTPGGPAVVIGNAAPVQLRGSARIVVPFCRNNLQVLVTHSDDDGRTWAPPENITNVTQPAWTWVGTGPPASLQLASGRVVVPAYHSTTPNDDGDFSVVHIMLSDDGGATWRLGGGFDVPPHYPNENQVVELGDGTLWCNARGLITSRLGATSRDGGESWVAAAVVPALQQPLLGCEGSTVLHAAAGALFYSGLAETSPLRFNLTLFVLPVDAGANATAGPWRPVHVVDANASAYSALALLPPVAAGAAGSRGGGGAAAAAVAPADLGLLYERAAQEQIIFEPDAISFERLPVAALLAAAPVAASVAGGVAA